MQIITFIRSKKMLIPLFLGFTGGALLLSNGPALVHYMQMPFNDVGVIAKERIAYSVYHQHYQKAKTSLFPQCKEAKQLQLLDRLAHQQAWNNLIGQKTLPILFNQLGITLPQEEERICLLKMVEGVDPDRTLAFLRQEKASGNEFEQGVRLQIMTQKCLWMLEEPLEPLPTPASVVEVDCCFIPLEAVNVKTIKKEESATLHLEKQGKQLEAQRTIAFIEYSVPPSPRDHQKAKEAVAALMLPFGKARLEKVFARHHSDWPRTVVMEGDVTTLAPFFVMQCEGLAPGKVLGPIQEGNGYWIYKFMGKRSHFFGHPSYRFLKIGKQAKVSEESLEQFDETIKEITGGAVSQLQWRKKVKNAGYFPQETMISLKEAKEAIGAIGARRKLVHWAYKRGNKEGSVSPPIEIAPSHYFIARLDKIQKAGQQNLKEQRKIAQKLLLDKKHKDAILLKLKPLLEGQKGVQEMAKNFPNHGRYRQKIRIDGKCKTLPFVGENWKALGTIKAFSQPGQRAMLPTKNGVLVIICKAVSTKSRGITQDSKNKRGRVTDDLELMNLLKKRFNVQDQRYLFYY